jgi:hypothetical protein
VVGRVASLDNRVVGRASREDRHASAARRIVVAAMTAPPAAWDAPWRNCTVFD